MKYYFYLVFAKTEHGHNYWRFVNDYESVTKANRIAVYCIESETEDDAFETAKQNLPVDRWDNQESVNFFELDMIPAEIIKGGGNE